MKKNTFRTILTLAAFGFIGLQAQAQGIVVNKTDGTKVYYKAAEVESVGVYGYAKSRSLKSQMSMTTNTLTWVLA